MKKLTREQIQDLRKSFEVWQQDYDSVHDKEQHDMFALGVAAMNEMLSTMDSESESRPEGAIGVFRVGKKSGQEPPVVLTEAVKNLPEGVYWLYATHQPTPEQCREWMARLFLAGYDAGHSRGLNCGRLYKSDDDMRGHRHACVRDYLEEINNDD